MRYQLLSNCNLIIVNSEHDFACKVQSFVQDDKMSSLSTKEKPGCANFRNQEVTGTQKISCFSQEKVYG